ncbi:hypothetical protein N9971_00240, partial [bacterium]|nr:hypothetical protein [bacterium]
MRQAVLRRREILNVAGSSSAKRGAFALRLTLIAVVVGAAIARVPILADDAQTGHVADPDQMFLMTRPLIDDLPALSGYPLSHLMHPGELPSSCSEPESSVENLELLLYEIGQTRRLPVRMFSLLTSAEHITSQEEFERIIDRGVELALDREIAEQLRAFDHLTASMVCLFGSTDDAVRRAYLLRTLDRVREIFHESEPEIWSLALLRSYSCLLVARDQYEFMRHQVQQTEAQRLARNQVTTLFYQAYE